MHFPCRSKKFLDIFFRQIIRSAVGTVHHANFPFRANRRQSKFRRNDGFPCNIVSDMQDIPGSQGTATMSAKTAQRKGRFASQIFRNINATANRQIATLSSLAYAELESISLMHIYRSVLEARQIIDLRRKIATGKGDNGIGMEQECTPGMGHLDSGGILGITDNLVCKPETVIIHRAARRNADIPIFQAARIILHRRL